MREKKKGLFAPSYYKGEKEVRERAAADGVVPIGIILSENYIIVKEVYDG